MGFSFLRARSKSKEEIENVLATSFCPIPWTHLSSHPNGDARICCDMSIGTEATLYNKWGKVINLKTIPASKLRNHYVLKKMRKEMLAGKRPQICGSCWRREDLGAKSRRQCLIETFPDLYAHARLHTSHRGQIPEREFPIAYFDLRLGNKCNLMCRSCGPGDSSLWMNYWMKYRAPTQPLHFSDRVVDVVVKDGKSQIMAESFDWDENAQLLQDFENGRFEHARMIYFTGGEPFINRHHWKILDLLIKQGRSQDIVLEYNSNVTVIPQNAFQLWSNFKRVHVCCSVDGIGPYGEYIRPPSKWSHIAKNLKALDQAQIPLSLELSPTISVLNIAHIPDMILWAYKMKFTRFHHLVLNHLLFYPEYLSIQVLPAKSKVLVKEKFERLWRKLENMGEHEKVIQLRPMFQSVLDHMFEADRNQFRPLFRSKISELDREFDQKLETQLPVVHQLIEGIAGDLHFEEFS